jgi:alkylhydroperoxidase family enzyme
VPRLPYREPSDLPAELQHAVGRQNFQRAYAHSPRAALLQRALHGYLREESRLDRRLRELAIVQVGYAAPCAYAYAHHLKAAVEAGVSDADLRAVADESAGRATHLEPLARAVLRAARELTAGYAVGADTFAALQRGLDNEELMDLLYTIACYTAMAKLLLSLEVDLEERYLPYLERFPIETS